MSDYIIEMKVGELKENPINSTIYEDNKSALEELKHSIELNGLLEPLTINRKNMVISGHRRLEAVRILDYEKVDCRLSEFENETIATIELNRYRQKTESELLKECEILKEEYSHLMKKKGSWKKNKNEGRNWTIVNISEKLGVSTTKLKKLLSIKNYEPEMLKKVDLGVISVEKAYQIIREKYILKESGVDYNSQQFKFQMKRMLDKYNPKMEEVLELVSSYYSGK